MKKNEKKDIINYFFIDQGTKYGKIELNLENGFYLAKMYSPYGAELEGVEVVSLQIMAKEKWVLYNSQIEKEKLAWQRLVKNKTGHHLYPRNKTNKCDCSYLDDAGQVSGISTGHANECPVNPSTFKTYKKKSNFIQNINN